MIHSELHRYQRGVIFSFVLSLVVFVLYVATVPNKIGSNLEQVLGGVWLVLYTSYCFKLRTRVPDKDEINEHKRPILHWVLLGIALIYFNIVKPNEFQSLYPIVNLGFVLFTLFSADAHWDFKKPHR